MVYPKDYEKKVGFDTIKELIKEMCYSNAAQTMVDNLCCITNVDKIEHLLDQVAEFIWILQFEKPIPKEEFADLTEVLTKYQIEGTFVEQEILLELRIISNTIKSWDVFFNKQEQLKFPELRKVFEKIDFNIEIQKYIDEIIDEKGHIKDQASPTLYDIRKDLIRKNSRVAGKIQQILTQLKKDDILGELSEITLRNGRMVIPIPASNKRKLKGFIHDESATGQTVFMEPAEIFELNNEIRELELQERREIVIILTHFTDFIRPFLSEIHQSIDQLIIFDFIRAKARFGLKINAIKPLIVAEKVMNWRKAIHPVLFLSLQKQHRQVVPLDIYLSPEKRILVISGPNAGGKSVCLKTIGLLQYMLQCGLLIPVSHGTQCTLFHHFFIDIGDEQSLENDLSTYSSHLLNMKQLVNTANENTIFLIDEFGAGTEPQIGGAIAEAVLDVVNENGAYGVITTHYTNLKLLAEHTVGIANASMQYDSNEMKPLFNLVIDIPGSSFAFEIANKIGLQKKVLDKAQSKIGKAQLTFDKQLQQLEAEKIRIEKKTMELEAADKLLAELIDKYTTLSNELDESKKYLINQAKTEAKNIVSEANKTVENTIKLIKENKADTEITKTLRNDLKDFSDTIKPSDNISIPSLLRKKNKNKKNNNRNLVDDNIIEKSEIVLGNWVRIIGQELIGEIIEIKNKQLKISYETSTLKTTIDKVEKIKKTNNIPKNKNKESLSQLKRVLNFDLNEKMAQFKATIDIRGTRAEEALGVLQQHIDEAILLNVPEIKIIHGKGNGILRQILRNLLTSIPEVTKFGDERLELGGNGATIVSFR